MKAPIIVAAAAAAVLALAQEATAASAAQARLQDAQGKQVGTVDMVQTAQGVLLDVQMDGLPQGTHAFHIHETGKCEPPFKSAGGHFSPEGKGHGMMDGDGMHAGDLPNIHMPAGPLHLEVLAQAVTLAEGKSNSLLDDDGSAVVVHQGPDDYVSDPAGNAGDRIACGVVEASE